MTLNTPELQNKKGWHFAKMQITLTVWDTDPNGAVTCTFGTDCHTQRPYFYLTQACKDIGEPKHIKPQQPSLQK